MRTGFPISSASGRVREEASVTMEVVIHGESLGLYAIRVDHYPSFEASQGNRTTVLHWGNLNEYLRDHDLVGDYATLDKFEDGSYRLTIDSKHPEEFMA